MPPRRVLLVVAFAAACLLPTAAVAQACAGARTTVTKKTIARATRATQCLVNAARRRAGLRRLHNAGPLDHAAGEHSQDMVARDFFDHVSPGGSTPSARASAAGFHGRAIGETIAWASGGVTPAAIVRMWMHSAPHRQVLLSGTFDAIGIGIAKGAPGRGASGATFTADLGS